MDDKIENGSGGHEGLRTLKELADLLRLRPSWVYQHADELGAYRLGKYLRFEVSRVLERLQNGGIGRSIVTSSTPRPLVSLTTKAASDGEEQTEHKSNATSP
jgi:hypothetical protein